MQDHKRVHQQFALYWGNDAPSEEEELLLKCYAASKTLRHAFSPKSGDPLSLELGGRDNLTSTFTKLMHFLREL